MAKKHYTQMTSNEKAGLSNIVKHWAGKASAAYHAMERMKERRIEWNMVQDALNNHNVIEFNFERGTARALVRGQSVHGKDNVCVVVALKTGTVLTAYRNKYNDNHRTIRWNEYDEKMQVANYLA